MTDNRPDSDRVALPVASLAAHPADGWQLAEPYRMGKASRRAYQALIRVLCPAEPAPLTPEMVDRVEDHVLRFMQYMQPVAAKGLHLAIWLLDWAPLFLFKSVHRLHALDRARASQILEVLTESRFSILRTLGVAVRGVTLSAYFDQQEVHRAIGYAPRKFMVDRTRLREQLLLKPAPVAAE